MHHARFHSRPTLVVVTAVACFLASRASAQVAVTGNVAGNVQGNVQGQQGGILVDAQGVVKPIFTRDGTGKLSQKRLEAFSQEHLSADLNKPSPLRKVSLVRLEAACAEFADGKKNLPPDMNFLAGLQRIEYLFVDEATNDLVIAGPAEGFAPDALGRMVGVTSGHPTLRLDDLLVALRALERGGTLGCSIDPVQERLAAFHQFIAQNSGPTSPGGAKRRYQQMADILGMHDVRIWGVPAESHFAQTLVEADYRMKLLSLGLETVPVRGFRSHLASLAPQGNSMQRWWITPLYEAFHTTEARDAFQFAGQRAQLLSQEEVTDGAGNRSDAPFTRLTTQKWAQLFTEKYPEIAAASPVFAELQHLIDYAVLGALLKKERLPQRVDWSMELFLDADRMSVGEGNAPRQVPTAFNTRTAGNRLIIGLVGGGISIDPMTTVRKIELTSDAATRLEGIRTGAFPKERAEKSSWWWD